jgi:hypothetical protein
MITANRHESINSQTRKTLGRGGQKNNFGFLKRGISYALAAVLLVTLIFSFNPGAAGEAFAAQPEELYIDDDYYELGVDTLPKGLTWSNNTLTMNGYNGGVIESDDDLKILLVGNNKITAEDENALGVSGALTIQGSGSLDVKLTANDEEECAGIAASSADISAAKISIDSSSNSEVVYGIFTWKSLKISCPDLTILTSGYPAFGIYTRAEGVSFAQAGVAIEAKGNNSYGIYIVAGNLDASFHPGNLSTIKGASRAVHLSNGIVTGSRASETSLSASSGSYGIIYKADLSYAKAVFPVCTYNDKNQTPEFTVITPNGTTLTKTNYSVINNSYANNKDAGIASVRIKGKGSYINTKTLNFTILPIGLDKVKIDVIDSIYTGKQSVPSIKIYMGRTYMSESKNRTLSCGVNKKVGVGTVTITGKGNLTGSVKKTFKIIPADAKGVAYKMGKKKMTVKWKKAQKAESVKKYQVQYQIKGKSKFSKIKTASKPSITIKKLKKGKEYRVRIRAVAVVSGKKYYGEWNYTISGKVK